MDKTQENSIALSQYPILFEAMLKGSISAVIEVASDFFNSPVIFTDENYRLICQIPNKPIGEEVWDTLYGTQILSAETIWLYQKVFLNDKTGNYQPFYANFGPVANKPRIFAEVYHGNGVYGHMAIFLGDRALKEGDLAYTKILTDALTILIKNETRKTNKWKSLPGSYLKDMLDVNVSYQLKNYAADYLQENLVGDLVLLVTPIGENAARKSFATYAVSQLYLQYRNIITVIYENCIITLIGEIKINNYDPKNNKIINDISNFLADHNMVSGISDCFCNIHEIPLYYKQAFLTAKLAINDREASLGIYNDYAPKQLYYSIATGNIPEAYLHPVLIKLREHDRENKTEYFETLRIYSLKMHNKEASSLELSIHRNTLLYRLNRIGDLFNLPYEDEKVALHLLTSFLLYEMMQ